MLYVFLGQHDSKLVCGRYLKTYSIQNAFSSHKQNVNNKKLQLSKHQLNLIYIGRETFITNLYILEFLQILKLKQKLQLFYR